MKRNITIQLWSTLMCFLLAATPVYADGTDGPDFVPASTHDPSIQSPQVAAMIRHDNVPIDLSTGGIDLKIPLVEWKDNDFECPVSLSYNSSGFRPREQDNFVGRNWMLNVGGIVYRKVNGVPDDMYDFPVPIAAEGNQTILVNGFLEMLEKRRFNQSEMLQDYQQNPYKYAKYKNNSACLPIIPGLSKDIEASADIFYFSFGKHSGKFMINFDGSVSASGNDGAKYEVDLKDMKMFRKTDTQETLIHIQTDDGYMYTFGGGGYSSLEYNALSWKNFFYNGEVDPQHKCNEITAWYLTEIQAPNGRKMTFTYRDDTERLYHTTPGRMNDLRNNTASQLGNMPLQYSLSCMSKYQSYRAAVNYYDINAALGPEPLASYGLTKVALLQRISTENCQICFSYSARERHIDCIDNEWVKDKFPYICGAKLDKVELTSNSFKQKAKLTYTYQCGNRMFLNSVTTREGKYEFQYNMDASVTPPSPLTSNIDHWGFWRGKRQNSGIIPILKESPSSRLEYTIESDDRNPTGEYHDYTLLRKVTYPTGGATCFEYEPHQYSRIPKQTFTTRFYVGLGYPDRKKEDLAGGARIRSVTHYDRNKAAKKIIYTYGFSLYMGELMYMPCYRYQAHHINDQGKVAVDFISFDSEGITDIPHPSIHIRYPEVTEHYVSPTAGSTEGKHPYKTTRFNDYLGNTNNYSDDFSYASAPEVPFCNPDDYFRDTDTQLYNKNLLAHSTVDVSLQFGKVMKESYYNADRQLVFLTEYENKYINKDKISLRHYTAAPHFGLRTGLYSHFIKEPFYEFVTTQKTSTRCVSGDFRKGMKTNEWIEYDKDAHLSRQLRLTSNGDSLINSYTYKQYPCTTGLQILFTGHSLRLTNPDSCQLIKRDTIIYSCETTQNNWYVPAKVISYDNNNSVQSTKEFYRYDEYGHPLEILTNGSEHIINLWSCYGQEMVAQIKNASYEEVRQALGVSPLFLPGLPSAASYLTGLQSRLPKAQVHTYSHLRGVGLLDETTPDGRTTHYVYDNEKARLTEIYRIDVNGDREILQINDYHLINE